MHFNEELLSDERYRQTKKNQQSEIIAKHCADIEHRIRSASSRLDAVQVAEQACTRFEQECPSTLVRTALTKHIEELISRYWNDSRQK